MSISSGQLAVRNLSREVVGDAVWVRPLVRHAVFGRRLDPSFPELHFLGEATLEDEPLHRERGAAPSKFVPLPVR